MASEQTDYEGRLPYGYWYGPEMGMEYLFDRGYNAIAGRSVQTPWVVEVYPKRQFIDAGPGRVEATYYTDSKSPRRDPETLALCEKIMARFCVGRDVRYWLNLNSAHEKRRGKSLLPKTGSRYLPRQISRKRMEELPHI